MEEKRMTVFGCDVCNKTRRMFDLVAIDGKCWIELKAGNLLIYIPGDELLTQYNDFIRQQRIA